MAVWPLLGINITLCSPLFFLCVLLSAGVQTAPEGSFASADALLSRLAHPASLCGALDYLEPDLAEKNPPLFAQKLQVCSPRVIFWEFVKTSVENEPPRPKWNEAGFDEELPRMFPVMYLPFKEWYMWRSLPTVPKWYELCDYISNKPFLFQLRNWAQIVII